tara:strand:+ start:8453 stop:9217 length:765 start_codon:yes stop_codon:yes gene_type:complete
VKDSSEVFKNYADYYDLLYQDKDYDAEVQYINNLINRNFKDAKKIIEFGSGTGIHSSKLSQYGFEIEGVELSKEMVRISKTSRNFDLFQGDMISYKSKNIGTFDIALSLFHVVSYLTNNADLESFFRNSYAHLKKDGLLIFDVWFSDAVEHTPPEIRIKRMKNSKLELLRISEPTIHDSEKIVDVNFTIFSKYHDSQNWNLTKEKHPMRHFSVEEIEQFAKKFNFNLLVKEEFLTSEPLTKDVWGACFVFQKNN